MRLACQSVYGLCHEKKFSGRTIPVINNTAIMAVASAWRRLSTQVKYGSLHSQFREFTMVPRRMFIDNLRVVALAKNVPGCVVECGVWRGGMSAGMAAVLGPSRTYHLFDSFEGLPPAQAIDGSKAIEWQQATNSSAYYDNCSAGEDFAHRAMRQAGAQHVHLVKGWFSDTVPTFNPSVPIAVLRLDGDWYESTMTCLAGLYDKVAPGGLIILDDYYSWDGCSRATHDFLSSRSAVERIRVQGAVCFIIKSAQDNDATH